MWDPASDKIKKKYNWTNKTKKLTSILKTFQTNVLK